MTRISDVRYARGSNASIAYQVVAEGPIDLASVREGPPRARGWRSGIEESTS